VVWLCLDGAEALDTIYQMDSRRSGPSFFTRLANLKRRSTKLSFF
jgi:hypothetical protein